MSPLLATFKETFKNFKCGEVYYDYFETTTIYFVECCGCGQKVALDDFPEHFQQFHLDSKSTDTTKNVVEQMENEDLMQPTLDEFGIVNTDFDTFEEKVPIEFMEVRLPKPTGRNSDFIQEHVTMDFDSLGRVAISAKETDMRATDLIDRKPVVHSADQKALVPQSKSDLSRSENKASSKAQLIRMRLRQRETTVAKRKVFTSSRDGLSQQTDVPRYGRATVLQRRNAHLERKDVPPKESEVSKPKEDVDSVEHNLQKRTKEDSSANVGNKSDKIDSKDDKDTKTVPVKYNCKLCHRSFKSERGLQHHVRVAHEEDSSKNISHEVEDPTDKPSFICNICGKSFSCLGNLGTHKKRHTGVKSHKCPECNKLFYTDHEMKSHLMLHTDLLPVICEVCGRGFRNTAKLKEHMRRHTGERPAKCDVCGKGFYSNHDRNLHRSSHTTERPFFCETCGSTFRNARALRVHKKLHVVERSHHCNLCGKGFIQANGLESHISQVHMNGNPFSLSSLQGFKVT